MNYAMALDYQNCINCKACEVACKEENGVQLGADKQRIWVGIVEGTIFGKRNVLFLKVVPNRPLHHPNHQINVLLLGTLLDMPLFRLLRVHDGHKTYIYQRRPLCRLQNVRRRDMLPYNLYIKYICVHLLSQCHLLQNGLHWSDKH